MGGRCAGRIPASALVTWPDPPDSWSQGGHVGQASRVCCGAHLRELECLFRGSLGVEPLLLRGADAREPLLALLLDKSRLLLRRLLLELEALGHLRPRLVIVEVQRVRESLVTTLKLCRLPRLHLRAHLGLELRLRGAEG